MSLAQRKRITARILQLAGSSIAAHIKTHSVETEQALVDQLCDDLQGNESSDTTAHARALSRSYISCLK
jgi:hypothetical protein